MPTVVNIAAYKFAQLENLERLRDDLRQLCQREELKGTILLSREGINLFVAGARASVDTLLAAVRRIPDLSDMPVKESFSDAQPFNRMLVKVKREIIAFGIRGIDPRTKTSRKISPQMLRRWLTEQRDLTLLDVRNDFEVEIGTFQNARPIGVDDFRAFPQAAARLPAELKKRPLVMFCTGGIRCEKAGPLLEQQGFQDVYQLDGGILKYFEDCGGEHYHGECFVFDKRVALDHSLRETETTQCYVCQAALTADDQRSEKYRHGQACPYCYKTAAQRMAETIAQRHEAICRLASPLPGSIPYVNDRPMSVPQRCAGMNVIQFLVALNTHLSVQQWEAICQAGELLLNGQPAAARDPVHPGQRYRHRIPATREPDVNADIRVLYEDDQLVVIDKPAPLPMHACGRFNRNTLRYVLGEVYRPTRLRPAHRLDADTSGVVVCTKTRQVAGKLQAQFQRGEVEKSYLVRIQGQPTGEAFENSARISESPTEGGLRIVDPAGLPAHTDFRVIQRFADNTALLEARPRTGRTNQIRIHLWDLGLPVCGDPIYLPARQLGRERTLAPDEPPLCQHARAIAFVHPRTRQLVRFTAGVPGWAESGG